MSKKIRCLLAGMGPGETAHARSMAVFLYEQGWEITVAVALPGSLDILKDDQDKLRVLLLPDPADLSATLNEQQPDVLILCNSKFWNKDQLFQTTPPAYKPLTICLDSNWLFNREAYPWFPFITWADQYYITFPQSVFEKGLAAHGGGFTLEDSIRNKVKPIGFIPSYTPIASEERMALRTKLGVTNDEKLILLYASGRGADFKEWIVEHLITAVKTLREQGKAIKVLYLGPQWPFAEPIPEWVMWEQFVDNFFGMVSASDLVFQHHGMGTLPQAISAGVPIIANVAIPGYQHLPLLHVWEVSPLAESGVCIMHQKTDPQEAITASVKKLLFDEDAIQTMKAAQQVFQKEPKGEEKVYELLTNLLA